MKIGIFSGTFDPVHAGHISFTLEAIEQAGLDKVYFLPEQVPRRKVSVTHYAHRIAMLKLALKPYQKLKIMELPDKTFSTNKTLPRIHKEHPNSEIYLLVGSDMVSLLNSPDVNQQWPDYQKFLSSVNLIVGVRNDTDLAEVSDKMYRLQKQGVVIDSKRPHASSRDIRSAVARGKPHKELLSSLKSYIKENWLYVSVEANIS